MSRDFSWLSAGLMNSREDLKALCEMRYDLEFEQYRNVDNPKDNIDVCESAIQILEQKFLKVPRKGDKASLSYIPPPERLQRFSVSWTVRELVYFEKVFGATYKRLETIRESKISKANIRADVKRPSELDTATFPDQPRTKNVVDENQPVYQFTTTKTIEELKVMWGKVLKDIHYKARGEMEFVEIPGTEKEFEAAVEQKLKTGKEKSKKSDRQFLDDLTNLKNDFGPVNLPELPASVLENINRGKLMEEKGFKNDLARNVGTFTQMFAQSKHLEELDKTIYAELYESLKTYGASDTALSEFNEILKMRFVVVQKLKNPMMNYSEFGKILRKRIDFYDEKLQKLLETYAPKLENADPVKAREWFAQKIRLKQDALVDSTLNKIYAIRNSSHVEFEELVGKIIENNELDSLESAQKYAEKMQLVFNTYLDNWVAKRKLMEMLDDKEALHLQELIKDVFKRLESANVGDLFSGKSSMTIGQPANKSESDKIKKYAYLIGYVFIFVNLIISLFKGFGELADQTEAMKNDAEDMQIIVKAMKLVYENLKVNETFYLDTGKKNDTIISKFVSTEGSVVLDKTCFQKWNDMNMKDQHTALDVDLGFLMKDVGDDKSVEAKILADAKKLISEIAPLTADRDRISKQEKKNQLSDALLKLENIFVYKRVYEASVVQLKNKEQIFYRECDRTGITSSPGNQIKNKCFDPYKFTQILSEKNKELQRSFSKMVFDYNQEANIKKAKDWKTYYPDVPVGPKTITDMTKQYMLSKNYRTEQLDSSNLITMAENDEKDYPNFQLQPIQYTDGSTGIVFIPKTESFLKVELGEVKNTMYIYFKAFDKLERIFSTSNFRELFPGDKWNDQDLVLFKYAAQDIAVQVEAKYPSKIKDKDIKQTEENRKAYAREISFAALKKWAKQLRSETPFMLALREAENFEELDRNSDNIIGKTDWKAIWINELSDLIEEKRNYEYSLQEKYRSSLLGLKLLAKEKPELPDTKNINDVVEALEKSERQFGQKVKNRATTEFLSKSLDWMKTKFYPSEANIENVAKNIKTFGSIYVEDLDAIGSVFEDYVEQKYSVSNKKSIPVSEFESNLQKGLDRADDEKAGNAENDQFNLQTKELSPKRKNWFIETLHNSFSYYGLFAKPFSEYINTLSSLFFYATSYGFVEILQIAAKAYASLKLLTKYVERIRYLRMFSKIQEVRATEGSKKAWAVFGAFLGHITKPYDLVNQYNPFAVSALPTLILTAWFGNAYIGPTLGANETSTPFSYNMQVPTVYFNSYTFVAPLLVVGGGCAVIKVVSDIYAPLGTFFFRAIFKKEWLYSFKSKQAPQRGENSKIDIQNNIISEYFGRSAVRDVFSGEKSITEEDIRNLEQAVNTGNYEEVETWFTSKDLALMKPFLWSIVSPGIISLLNFKLEWTEVVRKSVLIPGALGLKAWAYGDPIPVFDPRPIVYPWVSFQELDSESRLFSNEIDNGLKLLYDARKAISRGYSAALDTGYQAASTYYDILMDDYTSTVRYDELTSNAINALIQHKDLDSKTWSEGFKNLLTPTSFQLPKIAYLTSKTLTKSS